MLKKTLISFVWLLSYFFSAHSAYGSMIMFEYGTSMNCTLDSNQLIKVKTSSGKEVAIKISDIRWMAGQDIKRFRLRNKTELVTGEILYKKEIDVKEGEKTYSISLDNITFFGRPM